MIKNVRSNFSQKFKLICVYIKAPVHIAFTRADYLAQVQKFEEFVREDCTIVIAVTTHLAHLQPCICKGS